MIITGIDDSGDIFLHNIIFTIGIKNPFRQSSKGVIKSILEIIYLSR